MPKLEQLKQLASELHDRKDRKEQAQAETETMTPWATFMEAARGEGGLKRSLIEALGVLDSRKHHCLLGRFQ